ncbi:MAG: zinc ABC transporter substrate-binding protein [Deltaproteobacteria bacterium]|nr:zinc ABC transporter substrate-binding protein [Deltaproteobacteria bacterium]|tara:strand:- start:2492 stop:3436 length:945 start_codon:yes stop_codon:yes gene_type:complete
MKVRFYLVIISLLLFFSQTNADSNLNVVVSIKPYHSLVSGIMYGIASPKLLLKGNLSPHNYSLKPSDAERLQNADIIFWGGENLEVFLVKPLSSLTKKAKVVSVFEINGLKLKYFRHLNHMGKYENHESYISNISNTQYLEQQSTVDPHLWLDPENAKIITNRIVNVLSEFDPENDKKYQINGEKINVRLNELDKELSAEMREISNRTYLVLHDAYQYYESRYNLKNEGSITIHLDHFIGVSRLRKVQNMIKKNEVFCIFAEPQYSQKIIETLIKGTSVKKGILDPIGSNLLPGPELYFDLMKNLSISLKACLN